MIRLCLLVALLFAAGDASAQAAPGLSVRASGPSEGWRPVVEARGILQDGALQRALGSSLPLRFRLRVEVWRKGAFDRLQQGQDVHLVLIQDPLDREYRLETARSELRFPTLAEAGAALEAALQPGLRPSGAGRFYFLASLDVETLSLSDLDELRRWLRGEVQPALQGESSPGRAVERGLRRLFVRVMGLPTRRYEARSGTFRIQ